MGTIVVGPLCVLVGEWVAGANVTGATVAGAGNTVGVRVPKQTPALILLYRKHPLSEQQSELLLQAANTSPQGAADGSCVGNSLGGMTTVGTIVVGPLCVLVGEWVAGANVTGATVTGATVTGAMVAGATVTGATVTGAMVAGATVIGAMVAATGATDDGASVTDGLEDDVETAGAVVGFSVVLGVGTGPFGTSPVASTILPIAYLCIVCKRLLSWNSS